MTTFILELGTVLFVIPLIGAIMFPREFLSTILFEFPDDLAPGSIAWACMLASAAAWIFILVAF